MAKDDFDLDDLNFDDFDIEIPEFNDSDPTSDDRKPVEKLSAGFKQGFKTAVTDTATIKRTVGQALPRGYAQAFNAADAVGETINETFSSVSKDLQPFMDQGRRAASRIADKMREKNNAPKKIIEILDSFAAGGAETGYNAARAKQESEDNLIADSIQQLWEKQSEQQFATYTEEKAERTVRDAVEKKRYEEASEQQAIIARGVSRLVGYQDDVLIKFQQKQLELQYRHYFVARDLFEITSVHNEKMISAIDKVIKNTALPEAVKITQSEVAGQMLKERLAGAAFKNVANWTRDFRSKLGTNVKDYVSGFTSGISDFSEQGSSLRDTMGAAGGGGFVAGNILGNKIQDWGANLLAPILNRHEGLRRKGAQIGNFLNNAPRAMNRWARTETTARGARGFFSQMAKDLIPRFGLNDELANNQVVEADRPATFDNLTRRSIIEIIPGWLSQIARWTKASATGKIDSDDDMTVYNLEKGRFTSRREMLVDVKRRVMPVDGISSMRNELDSLLKDLTKDSNISDGAYKALRKKILSDIARGEPFDPRDLTKPQFYKDVEPEYVDELRYFFRNRFRVTEDGYLEQTADDMDELGELQSKFNSIGNMMPDPANLIRELQDVHGRSTFDRLGYTRRVGNQELFDYSRVFEDMLNDSDIGTHDGTDYSSSAAAQRVRSAQDVNDLLTGGKKARSVQGRSDVNVDSTALEKYLGEDSATVRELREIKERVSNAKGSETDMAILQMLATVVDRIEALQTGVPVAGEGKAQSFAKRFSKSLITAPFKLGWGVTKGYFNGLKFSGKLGIDTLRGAGGMAMDGLRGAKNFMFNKGREAKGMFDYHVAGRAMPAIRGELLAAKEYYDVNSKKWIDDVSQITGDVRDKAGRLVLSAQEFKDGLVTQHGKKIKSRFSSLMSGVGSFVQGGFTLSTLPYKAAWGAVKLAGQALFGAGKDMSKGAMDYFLHGERSPRLLGIKLEQGAYFDSVTRKPIAKLSDIKGDVMEYVNGRIRVVVKNEELIRSGGFYDYMGRKIAQGMGGLVGLAGRGIRGAAGLAWGMAKLPFQAAGALLKGGYNMLSGKKAVGARPRGGIRAFFSRMFGKFRPSGDWNHDMLTLAQNQVEVLERIHDKVDKLDGGMMSGLSDLLDLGGRGRRRGRGGRGGRGGRPGRGPRVPRGVAGNVARAGTQQAARTAATSATSTIARTAGRQLLWQGARMAGAAVLGVVSAPVLIGAAVVTAAAVGGYLVYRHYANKPTALRGMRFAQYGIKPNDPDQVQAVMALEELLMKTVSYTGEGEAKVDTSKITIGQLAEIFKFDPENEDNLERIHKLGQWSKHRFQPVLLAHLTAAKRLAKGIDFKELDEKIPAKIGIDFVNSVRLDNMKSVYDDVDTSPFDDELDSDSGDVKKWIEKALEEFKERAEKDPNAKKEDDKGFFASAWDKTKENGKKALALATWPQRKMLAAARAAGGLMADGAKSLWSNTPDSIKAGLAATPLGMLVKGWDTLSKIRSRITERDRYENVTLDALTAGRYRVFGAKRLLPDVVEPLYKLESLIWDQISYDGKQAVFNGQAEDLYPEIAKIFGISPDDTNHKASWFAWFSLRYMPAFLQFCTSVRSLQSVDAREATRRLTPSEQHKVLKEMAATTTMVDGESTSIWDIKQSPWKDYDVNTDPDSIKGNLDELDSSRGDKDYGERTKAMTNVQAQTAEARRRGNIDQETIGLSHAERAAKDREESGGFFNSIKNTLFGREDVSGARTGGWFTRSVDPNEILDKDAGPLKGGIVMGEHPGGGTGGDINSVPAPTGPGWEGSKATIITAAKMAGVDPYVAANVASIESRFDPNARPYDKRKKKYLSSATGYYQFIDETWKAMLKKYGSKYGISPNASPLDGRANALMGMEFLKENADGLKKHLGRDITDVDLYAAHFLGLGGAKRLLGAPTGADARGHVASNVPGANESVFFEKGRARTVSQVYSELTRRMSEANKLHDVKAGSSYSDILGEGGEITNEAVTEGAADAQPVSTTTEPFVDRNAAINGPAPSVTSSGVTSPQATASAATTPTGESSAPEAPRVSETAAAAKAQVEASNSQTTVVATGLDGVSEGVNELTGVNVSMDDKLAKTVSLLEKLVDQGGIAAKAGQNIQQNVALVNGQKQNNGSPSYLMRHTRNRNA